MFPYKEDLVRYDFEVGAEDEWMWNFPANEVDGANGINGTNGVSNNYQ
jgi:hypothetical protein